MGVEMGRTHWELVSAAAIREQAELGDYSPWYTLSVDDLMRWDEFAGRDAKSSEHD